MAENLGDEPSAVEQIEQPADKITEQEAVLNALFNQTFERLRMLTEQIKILNTIVNKP